MTQSLCSHYTENTAHSQGGDLFSKGDAICESWPLSTFESKVQYIEFGNALQGCYTDRFHFQL